MVRNQIQFYEKDRYQYYYPYTYRLIIICLAECSIVNNNILRYLNKIISA